MHSLPAALAPMAAYRQFLIYSLHPREGGKTDKLPRCPRTGAFVDAHDPQYWTDAATACTAATLLGLGVAFVFTANDPFFFLDADAAYHADAGWSATAQQLIAAFPGAAVEVSSSGTGLHIFGTYAGPLEHGTRCTPLGLELYTSKRFVALTGINAQGDASTDGTAYLQQLVAACFPPRSAGTGGDLGLTDAPDPAWRGPTDDADLIRRACQATSAATTLGGRAGFADLWLANVEALARTFPHPTQPYDASTADMALASHLAFWTGRHGTRMVSLMQQAGIRREKYDRDDYLPRTVLAVLGAPGEVCQDKPLAPVPGALPTTADTVRMQARDAERMFVQPDEMPEILAGCVYVTDVGLTYVPGRGLLPAERFRVVFGGYVWPMDRSNERHTRDAWEAFTQCPALRMPEAATIAFKPNEPPGAILVQRGGRTAVNIFEPVTVRRQTGDPGPFLQHLAKLLPDERDRTILLSYMAACVQHIGVKFQWAPFIQGVEGNGKTFLSRCVANALGARYVHWPKASKLASQFNGWMVGKLLYCVEDLYFPGGKLDAWEEVKPMITGGDGLEIERKGVDQTSMDICGNFILNSNHKDAIPKTRNDRRAAPFYTAQQGVEDLARDGMNEAYMRALYDWADGQDGYAIVADYLHSYAIPPEFNPAGACQRAPRTSSTDAAINAAMGSVEQHVLEAIQQGRPGFMGGWVSSVQLAALLDQHRIKMSMHRRESMLAGMGYIPHPRLPHGRVAQPVQPDGMRPVLFVLKDTPLELLPDPAGVYAAAQKTQ